MAMHPKLKPSPAGLLLDLLFPTSRAAALAELQSLGLSPSDSAPRWQALLPVSQRDLSNLVLEWKLRLDAEASQEGLVSVRNVETIVGNMLTLGRLQRPDAFAYARVREQTILDYGSGVFYALSAAILLRANGYAQVYALEPYPLRVEFVVASVLELVHQLFQNPARFNFSGLPNGQLKARIAELDLGDLATRLEAFNARQIGSVELGGVSLLRSLDGVQGGGLDTIFSNSVLEHVQDFPEAMQALRAALKPDGVCLHTVDFADHRYYADPQLHPFEMYFDGVLFEINGMRPGEMEQQFTRAGFQGHKHRKLPAPPGCFEQLSRPVLPAFAAHGDSAFSDWVNGYVLTPV